MISSIISKKLTIISLLALLFFWAVLIDVNVRAATTASVTATVTAQNIAVIVDDGTVTYGTLGVGSSQVTTSIAGGLDDTQGAVNAGNIPQDFNIKGQNSVGSPGWALMATPGADQYAHKFCTSNCATTPTWISLGTGYTALTTSIAVGATQSFDLVLFTPITSSDYTQQSVDVTVQAVAP
jgi:hypothetical protein